VNTDDEGPHVENLKLRYGKGEVALDLTGHLRVKMLSPRRADPPQDLDADLTEALRNPVASAPLADMARDKGKIVVSIPDRTRPRIARRLLPTLLAELEAVGIGLEKVTIFVATGTHGEHSEAELIDLVGEGLAGRVAVRQNRSRHRDDFAALGTTTRGTPVHINRTLVEADLNIIISPVASHYFAGWGGGRKMILPGASQIETAWANHRLTLTEEGDMNPLCRSGLLDGNPVHEDMVEAAGMIGNCFLINAVLDGWAGIACLNAGDIIESHRAATEIARGLLEVEIPEKCSLAIVSSGGHPLDINFIQSHKSMDHVAPCIRPGGIMIAVAECGNGAGSETFLPWFDFGDRDAVSRKLLDQYELNGHTALSLMKKLEDFRIVFVSSLSGEVVERMGMIPAASVDEAVATAEALLGQDTLIYVFPCAWGILPEMRVT
jgi:nickel-dependent lactate racemase